MVKLETTCENHNPERNLNIATLSFVLLASYQSAATSRHFSNPAELIYINTSLLKVKILIDPNNLQDLMCSVHSHIITNGGKLREQRWESGISRQK